MAKLAISIVVEVGDMDEDQLRDAGYYDYGDEQEAAPFATDYSAIELAECVVSALSNPDARDEMFAGSDIFVTVGDAQITSAKLLT